MYDNEELHKYMNWNFFITYTMSEILETLNDGIQICNSSRMENRVNPLLKNKGAVNKLINALLPIVNMKSKSSKLAEVIAELSSTPKHDESVNLKRYRVVLPSNVYKI